VRFNTGGSYENVLKVLITLRFGQNLTHFALILKYVLYCW